MKNTHDDCVRSEVVDCVLDTFVCESPIGDVRLDPLKFVGDTHETSLPVRDAKQLSTGPNVCERVFRVPIVGRLSRVKRGHSRQPLVESPRTVLLLIHAPSSLGLS
jgi:hypothetical protein